MLFREQLGPIVLFLLLCVFPGFVSTLAGGGSTSLQVGDEAPDFELTDQNGETVRLSQFRGHKNVVVAFYVLAFTSG
jgi:cytochrome oxidase Cu insertion factor (SCO1/SenC/PrrC family)